MQAAAAAAPAPTIRFLPPRLADGYDATVAALQVELAAMREAEAALRSELAGRVAAAAEPAPGSWPTRPEPAPEQAPAPGPKPAPGSWPAPGSPTEAAYAAAAAAQQREVERFDHGRGDGPLRGIPQAGGSGVSDPPGHLLTSLHMILRVRFGDHLPSSPSS